MRNKPFAAITHIVSALNGEGTSEEILFDVLRIGQLENG